MHSRMRPKYKPTINGKVVDLDLLYQIVTSHGGWEKVNNRNEWDDLLEHFHLPRGTNGGLVIKQIYLKYLENYEKIYFLGEDAANKDDTMDDYDDVRNRRRTASKMTSRSSYSQTPSASSANPQGQGPSESVLNPLSVAMREQLGLPKPVGTDYDKLVLSLQSPLPNEQDVALSICTLLCNETKHVIKLSKCPTVLSNLLAHAGVYQNCGLRSIMEETYVKGREMDLSGFWEENITDPDVKSLLCESYVKRIQGTLGIEDEAVVDPLSSFEGSESDDPLPIMDEEFEPQNSELMEDSPVPTPRPEFEEKPVSPLPTTTTTSLVSVTKSDANEIEVTCCESCPCSRLRDSMNDDLFAPPPPPLSRSHGSDDDKVCKRIHQVALILRNLSFEEDNASVMAGNSALLRYLLLTANCKVGTLPQNAFDTIGNISNHIKLQDPSKDPITSMLLSLLFSGLFSEDRYVILGCLEAIRNLTKTERNERVLVSYMEKKVCKRLCELLTLCDIMLLIYTLECILSITGIGESVCNELVRVKGSVASFVALVTVEAQSYGPKGCILMRVVETVASGHVSSSVSTSGSSTQAAQPLPQGKTSLSVGSSHPSSVNNQGSSHSSAVNNQETSIVQASTITPSTVEAQNYGPKGCILMRVDESVASGQTSASAGPIQAAQPLGKTSLPVGSSLSSLVNNQETSIVQVSTINSTPGIQGVNHINKSPVFQTNSAGASPRLSYCPSFINSSTVEAQNYGPKVCIVMRLVATVPSDQRSSSTGPAQAAQLGSSPSASVNNQEACIVQVSTINSSPGIHSVNHTSKSPVFQTSTTGASPSVSSGLTQVSSQSLTQHVFQPAINSENLTEEAWATAWLKGGFEQLSGTSIEEGELYRMYCVARKKHPASLLSQSQLVQCVKLVYGASVGPVTKNFGSTSLSFIEGLRPKMIPFQNSSVPSSVNTNAKPPSVTTNNDAQPATNGMCSDGSNSSITSVPRPTTPSLQSGQPSSPLSPILKATLSRPPTPKSPTAKHKSKTGKVKQSAKACLASKKKSKKSTDRTPVRKPPEGKIMSPSSSAIRSLLASKVAQRQQKKLQESKNSKKGDNCNSVKMNGEASLEKGEESSASSSINSSEDDSKTENNAILSFHGILCNGTGGDKDNHMDVDELSDDLGQNAKVKGMLVDLLERKVAHKDATNGIVGREIRISDRGLEIIENQNSDIEGGLLNDTLGTTETNQEPQKMTFYASPEVVASENNCNSLNASTTPQTVLLSGGGNGTQSQVVTEEESAEVGDGASSGDGNFNANIDLNGSGAGNDLLEKVSQFSDLIVVNPEQLGLKRPAPVNSENSDATGDDAPPAKKPALCVNGIDDGPTPIPVELLDQKLPYLCEWAGCGYRFPIHSQVFMHAVTAHCPDPSSTEAVRCEWGSTGCDPLLRKRLSIMTHLQDRHCNKQALDLACYRRKNKIEPPPAPQQPVHHPGYAPNAAFHAIKRHALQYMNPKDVVEENEGPVTKSIRLTSALILRNLANFSPLGRRMITAYESQLANIAMSNAESSRTISQLLYDMSESSDI